ncbi:hypothetical protein [Streptomyces lavendulae]|uniref:hypothetical protein n=1 Tax=Streptomyces lavendulae TaxID=1914 RepID=UPI0036E4710F
MYADDTGIVRVEISDREEGARAAERRRPGVGAPPVSRGVGNAAVDGAPAPLPAPRHAGCRLPAARPGEYPHGRGGQGRREVTRTADRWAAACEA